MDYELGKKLDEIIEKLDQLLEAQENEPEDDPQFDLDEDQEEEPEEEEEEDEPEPPQRLRPKKNKYAIPKEDFDKLAIDPNNPKDRERYPDKGAKSLDEEEADWDEEFGKDDDDVKI